MFLLTAAGFNGPVGDAIAREGVTADGNATKRRFANGDATQSPPAHGNTSKGEKAGGNATDGDASHCNSAESDNAGGAPTDGDNSVRCGAVRKKGQTGNLRSRLVEMIAG